MSHRRSLSQNDGEDEKGKGETEREVEKRRVLQWPPLCLYSRLNERREERRVWPKRTVWKGGRERESENERQQADGMNKASSAHLHQAQPHKDKPVPQKGEKTNTTHLERSASEPLLYTPLFPGYPTPPEAGLMDIPAIFSSLSSLSGDYTSTWTTLKVHKGPLEEKDPLRQAQLVYRCVYTWVCNTQCFGVTKSGDATKYFSSVTEFQLFKT